MRDVWAFVSYWEFDFALFWTFLLLLVVACLVAPWVHRARARGRGRAGE